MDLKAFHNDVKIKKKYLDRVKMHQALDHLVKGVGFEKSGDNVRACAVGCTLESYNHASYEVELGIPEWLARVEDTLFEGMSLKKSKTWPEVFLKNIPIGADLNKIKSKFLVVVLKHSLVSMDAVRFDAKAFPQVESALKQSQAAVKQMISAQRSQNAAEIKAAYSAADAAHSAAYSAAHSAYSAADAAYSAAYSAADAAYAAYSAAYSAADAAHSAAYSAAHSATDAAAYDFYADELIKLFKSLKPKGK